MTLGEIIIDFYYWDYLEPFVSSAVDATQGSGFPSWPMSTSEEMSFHSLHPEFKTIMEMPGLALRIILSACGGFHYEPDLDSPELICFLELLNGLAIWCRHRAGSYLAKSVVPDLGEVKTEHFNDWVAWAEQRGYIRD